MKVKKTLLFGLMAATLLAFATEASGATVQWILGMEGPSSWTVNPTNPTSNDLVGFSGPTDQVYDNYWVGEVSGGGSPNIIIDSENYTIELWFEPPPPTDIPTLWDPVCGLQGEFGPLDEGNWTFFCDNPVALFSISFQVIPEPCMLSLIAFSSLALIRRKHRNP